MSGVSKGTLSGSNPYILPISGFTSDGTLSVAVAKSYYKINGSPKTVSIYAAPPAVPSDVTATPNSYYGITISWSPVSGASAYKVYCSDYNNYNYTYDSSRYTDNPMSCSYRDPFARSVGTTYYYKVSASNGTKESSLSSEVSATIDSLSGIPYVPLNLYGYPSPGGGNNNIYSIYLSWWLILEEGGGFNIYRSYNGSSYNKIVTLSFDERSYDDRGLSSNTTYYYKVSAYNSNGEGPLSSPISVRTGR